MAGVAERPEAADGPSGEQEEEPKVVYKLRDRQASLCEAWTEQFGQQPLAAVGENVQISTGDIFHDAPSADAIVSPANSFGFMDGGIDAVYTRHFGYQMQERLQNVIREQFSGELLVGQAVIIPTFAGGAKENSLNWALYNEGKPIKYLVSAPTMRIPCNVSETVNAFLAFRAVILAVKKHNATPGNERINSVLCPGLGTAVGKMPYKQCAYQMLRAYEVYELGMHKQILTHPTHLSDVWYDNDHMMNIKS